jgi:hypothetical protein
MKIVLASVAAFALGYFVAKVHLEQYYDDRAMEEINDSKEYFAAKYEQKVADHEELLKGEKSPNDLRKDLEPVPMGAFSPREMAMDAHVERALTSYQTGVLPEQVTEEPVLSAYVISDEAFIIGEQNYEQITVTWYEGDQKLTGEGDRLLTADDIERSVGHANLEKFGEESGNVNIVYLRNDALQMDFEVVRSTGKYSTEVLGLDS